MDINLTTHRDTAALHGITTARPAPAGSRRRWWLTVPGLAGIGYTLSWVAGLAVPVPSPRLGASGPEVVAALAGHGPAVAAQFALTEGLPAIGIAVISVALARFARHRRSPAASRLAP